MSDFIQPSFVEKMLLSDDADGFSFLCSLHKDVLLDEPIPSNIPSLKSIYTLLRTIHSSTHTYLYVLSGDALEHTWSITTNWFVVKVNKWMETFKGSCLKLGATQLDWQ